MTNTIVVHDLVQHYGVKPILKHINLEVRQGELLALMGPNGMGKSTLLSAMAGLLSPQKGYVEINGKRRRSSVENEKAIRQSVFYMPDQPFLPLHNTGREYVLAMGRLYGVEDERLMAHGESLFALFNLTEKADSLIDSYSTGQKKKVAICAALVTEVPIYLLDEPFSGGLDPSALLALKKIVRHLAQKEDVTLVIATPVPEIIDEIAHRVAIIRSGELVALDTPENLKKSMPKAESLEDVLEQLVDPKTLEHYERYVEEFHG